MKNNLIEQFKQYLFSQDKKASSVTVKNYMSDINHFTRWFEKAYGKSFEPKEVTGQVIDEYKTQASEIFSASSLDRHFSSLRKFFKFLLIEGVISINPLEIRNLKLEIRNLVGNLKFEIVLGWQK